MALIAQPNVSTIECLDDLLTPGTSAIDASIAYATFSGVRLLFESTSIRKLKTATKRFLIGIDWFRSEPSAIDALHNLSNGSVKIMNGKVLVRQKCRPRTTFHPKAYLVKASKTNLVVGSANLSELVKESLTPHQSVLASGSELLKVSYEK